MMKNKGFVILGRWKTIFFMNLFSKNFGVARRGNARESVQDKSVLKGNKKNGYVGGRIS